MGYSREVCNLYEFVAVVGDFYFSVEQYFYVKDKQKINVYFNVTALVLRILVLLLGGFYFRSSDWTIFFWYSQFFTFLLFKGLL